MKSIHKNIFNFDLEFNWKSVSLLSFLVIFPNVLGLFHTEIFNVRIHFFQYLIFLAAVLYGPFGGALAGSFGSLYTAIALNNPYIIIGNILLGFFTGLFFRLRFNIIIAVFIAYFIQLPWLWVTDIYLAGMPVNVVKGIVIGLLISDLIFAFLTLITYKKIKNFIIS